MSYQNRFLSNTNLDSNKLASNESSSSRKNHSNGAYRKMSQENIKVINKNENKQERFMNRDSHHRSISVSSPSKYSYGNIHTVSGAKKRSSMQKHRRSKSSSNDLIFVERKHRHGMSGHSHKYVPSDFEYKGKLKIKCNTKKIHKLPYQFIPPQTEFGPHITACETIIPSMHNLISQQHVPMEEHGVPPPILDYYGNVESSRFKSSAVNLEAWSHPYSNSGGMYESVNEQHFDGMLPYGYPQSHSGGYHQMMGDHHYAQSSSGGGSGNIYPPIPPGAKIIAQYVKEIDEIEGGGSSNIVGGGTHPSSSHYYQHHHSYPATFPNLQHDLHHQQTHHYQEHTTHRPMSAFPYERIVEKCVPRSKIIEVWRKQRMTHSKDHQSLDSLKKDIVETITNEIKKLNLGTTHTHVTQTQPSEKDVKVIVQPIQPVFYLPRNPSTPAPAPTYPVAPNPPPPAAPTVVYVPRNVYVPVIKPVFVPRERVIVRPQIVQVARPVVIDRPIPVTQRPIVIDRERPVPFPVSSSLPVGQVSNEQYIYRDNLPLAYGGRTGEFATGMNYGYMPVNEDYQYIVSESDDLLRQQLVNSHLQHNQQYQLHTNSGYYGSQGDCFDQALEEATSGRSVDFYSKRNEHKSIPNQARVASSSNVAHYTNINVADENRNALVETLRRAGTGCVNLEVLDPTVRPVWEPINAKMLIQRYGQSAIRFVESGSSYGYNSFLPYSNNNSNISLGDNVSQSKFQDINISTEYIPTPVSGSYGHGSSIHNYENRSLMNGSGFSPADFGNYNSSNINNYGYHSEGSFDDMELSKYKSTSSLQMGGGIDKWPASNLYNRHEELAAHTSVM